MFTGSLLLIMLVRICIITTANLQHPLELFSPHHRLLSLYLTGPARPTGASTSTHTSTSACACAEFVEDVKETGAEDKAVEHTHGSLV